MAKKKVTFDPDYQRAQLSVGIWVLKEAAGREAIRRVNMAESAKAWIANHPEDSEAEQILGLYPHIAGCAWPIILIEQFLELPETMLDELSQAAMKLNAHWFASPDQEKKTDEPQPTSSVNLPTS
ncbi:MAG: hypothetical protein QX196_15700 [Methylococcaceae bacterium]